MNELTSHGGSTVKLLPFYQEKTEYQYIDDTDTQRYSYRSRLHIIHPYLFYGHAKYIYIEREVLCIFIGTAVCSGV